MAEGQDLGIDAYPYLAGPCNITQSLPTWAQEGGVDALLARLADPDLQVRIADERVAEMSNNWDDILISNAPATKVVCGRTVQAVADERGATGIETVIAYYSKIRGF